MNRISSREKEGDNNIVIGRCSGVANQFNGVFFFPRFEPNYYVGISPEELGLTIIPATQTQGSRYVTKIEVDITAFDYKQNTGGVVMYLVYVPEGVNLNAFLVDQYTIPTYDNFNRIMQALLLKFPLNKFVIKAAAVNASIPDQSYNQTKVTWRGNLKLNSGDEVKIVFSNQMIAGGCEIRDGNVEKTYIDLDYGIQFMAQYEINF